MLFSLERYPILPLKLMSIKGFPCVLWYDRKPL